MKKVKIYAHLIGKLAENDVMASVNKHLLPMYLDSGAEKSIVPQEFVEPSISQERLSSLREYW